MHIASAGLEKMTRSLNELHATLISKLGGGSKTTESPSEAGKRVLTTLKGIRGLTVFAPMKGLPPVLMPRDQDELLKKINIPQGKESALVDFITPFLWRLRVEERQFVGDKCPPVLVNSELDRWLKAPDRNQFMANRLKPDLFCTWEPFIMRKPRASRAGDPRYVFGVLANPMLQQEGVVREFYEAKAGKLGNKELAQLHQYHSYIAGNCRGMLFSPTDFWLYETFDGAPVRLIQAQWTQDGTAALVQKFFSEGVDEPRLLQVLRQALERTGSKLKPDPFLGGGAFGRVFHVQVGRVDRALKITMKDVDRLCKEYDILHHLHTIGAPVIAPVADSRMILSGHAGCYMLQRVGAPYAVTSRASCGGAFNALRAIHHLGYSHGDARLPNLLAVDGAPVWIDVAGSLPVAGIGLAYFREDMEMLARSIIAATDLSSEIQALVDAYTPDDLLTLDTLVSNVWSVAAANRATAAAELGDEGIE